MSEGAGRQIEHLFENSTLSLKTEEDLEELPHLLVENANRESELKRLVAEKQFSLQALRVEQESELEFIEHSLFRQLDRAQSLGRKIQNMDMTISGLVSGLSRLNNAKRNLQGMITFTRKFQMLHSSIQQLQDLMRKASYRDIASLLLATLQFVEYLAPKVDVFPKLSVEIERVHQLENELWNRIFGLFQASVGNRGFFPKNVIQLADAALVVDVLGAKSRRQLINWYCEVQLKDYKSVFRGNIELATLSSFQKRFHWLKRLLETYKKDHEIIFMDRWKVPEALSIHFCALTSKDIVDIINKPDCKIDPELLLSNIKETQALDAELRLLFPSAAKGTFNLASSFESQLHLFLKLQEAELSSFIDGQPKRLGSSDSDSGHLVCSAPRFFLLIRDTLQDILSLASPKTTKELFPLINRYLGHYARYLQSQIPKKPRKGYGQAELKLVCILLNTADYCIHTGQQLNDKIKELLLSFDIKPSPPLLEASLYSAIQAFHILSSLCNSLLDGYFEETLESAWETMASMIKGAWNTKHQVGDQSKFVAAIQKELNRLLLILKNYIVRPATLRTSFSKLSRAILERFQTVMYHCRPISESGAQQLLVDLFALKKGFQDQLASLISRNWVEAGTLDDLEEDSRPSRSFVETYLMLSGDPNPAIFKRVVDLKGGSKAEQAQLLEEFIKLLPETPSGKQITMERRSSRSSPTPLGKFRFKFFQFDETAIKTLLVGTAKRSERQQTARP